MRQGALARQRAPKFLVILSLTLASALLVSVVEAGVPAAAAESALVVSGDRQEESLDGALRAVGVPAEQTLSAATARHLSWQPADSYGFSPGFSGATWWLRADVQNIDQVSRPRVVRIEHAALDDVQFLMSCSNGRTDSAVGGNNRPLSELRLPDRNPSFDFIVPAHARCSLLFRIASLDTLQFPAVIADPKSYNTRQQRDSMIRGVGLGMQCLLLVATLVAAVVLRSPVTARLALLVFVQTATAIVLGGMGFQLLWSEWPALQRALVGIAVALCWTMTALYCLRVLTPDVSHGATWRLTFATCAIAAGASVLNIFLPWPGVMATIVSATALGLILLLVITFSAVMMHIHHSSHAAAGVAVLAVGALIDALGYLGFLSLGGLFLLPTQFAFLGQTALFGLAQMSPTVRLQADDTPRPKTVTAMEQEVNRRVAERTRELSRTVAQLTTTNRQLDQMSSTDALTGTWNRRHMDHYLAQSAEEVRSLRSSLSIILFDLDHFKEVNDQHGHRTGDHCLRLVAECVQQQLRDESDILCRYGGEEFAVILPHTDLEGAQAVAEKIRCAVEQTPLLCGPGIVLHLTISLGVAVHDPSHGPDVDLEQLVNDADHALYQAKETGRNRWLTATA